MTSFITYAIFLIGSLVGTLGVTTYYAQDYNEQTFGAQPALTIAQGGTGWTNIQQNAIPYGSGNTLRVSTTTQGTAGQVLTWNNGIPTWAATSTCIQITGSADLCDGSDAAGSSFTYPFPNNATSTLLRFNGGASTTNFSANRAAIGGTGTTTITSTGVVQGPNGGTSEPTYSFGTDTNTGMFLVSGGILGFVIDGTGRAALSSTQLYPYTNDATSLGSSGNAWSDLFLASGGVLDFGGDVAFTHSAGNLTLSSGDHLTADFASTTALSATTLCLATDCRTTWPTGGGSYPFPLTGNATSTLTQFNGGLTAYGSSTIGAGGATTGLTVFGSATTTNHLQVMGSVAISATSEDSIPFGKLGVLQTGTSNSSGLVLLNSGRTASARWYIDANGTQRLDNGSSATGIISLNGAGAGSVGVGTTSPAKTLAVQGAGIFSGDLSVAGLTATGTVRLAGLNAANCDVKADTSGVLSCGTDSTGAGGGSFPFTPTTNFGAISNATGTPLWLQGTPISLMASSTIKGTTLDLQEWTVSTSTTVCAYNCEFTSIQTALNAGYKDIQLKAENYTGPVSIIASDTTIRGAGLYNTTISCAGGVCVSIATTTALTRITLEDFGIDSTSAGSGIGLDTSMTSNVYAKGIRITDFNLGHLVQDGSKQETFYHAYENMVYFDNNNCFRTASTTGSVTNNLANANSMYTSRCRVASATGIGYDILNSEGWTFYSPNSEPGSVIGTGFRVDGNSMGITVITPWFEANATGTEIQSGAANVKFVGGRITGNTRGVWDRGTRTSFDNTLITANTTNVDVTGNTSIGIYTNSDSAYSGSFMAIGTSTRKDAHNRLALGISTSDTTASALVINNSGAFATSPAAIEFTNSTGGFPNGTARIAANPGSGYTDASLAFWVADTAKAQQQRMTIDVAGDVGIGTTTPFARLSVTGASGQTTPLFDVTNSTFNSFLRVHSTGTTTISGPSAATSTQYMYSTAASKGAVIILEDTDGAGCTEVSALNGVLTAKIVTCPTEI